MGGSERGERERGERERERENIRERERERGRERERERERELSHIHICEPKRQTEIACAVLRAKKKKTERKDVRHRPC